MKAIKATALPTPYDLSMIIQWPMGCQDAVKKKKRGAIRARSFDKDEPAHLKDILWRRENKICRTIGHHRGKSTECFHGA